MSYSNEVHVPLKGKSISDEEFEEALKTLEDKVSPLTDPD